MPEQTQPVQQRNATCCTSSGSMGSARSATSPVRGIDVATSGCAASRGVPLAALAQPQQQQPGDADHPNTAGSTRVRTVRQQKALPAFLGLQLLLLWLSALVARLWDRDNAEDWDEVARRRQQDSSASLTLTGDLAVVASRAVEQHVTAPDVSFFVGGVPAPQGSKRPFRNKFSGKIAMVEQSKRAPNWRRDIHEAAETAMAGRQPLDGALQIELRFVFPRPASHLSARGGLKPSAPLQMSSGADIDKLCRGVLDALCIRTGGRVIVDDRLVCRLVATKEYGERPGCWVEVRRLA
jgi:Holliday junction resolvase RusA-like endonuclease